MERRTGETARRIEALAATHATDLGITFDPAQLDAQATAIRITLDISRLMDRLLARLRRVMTLHYVEEIKADIAQAARDGLVIEPGN